MKEIFTMSQRSSSRSGGVFINGLLKEDNISIYDFKKSICDAWDYSFNKSLFESTEIDISNNKVLDFATSDIDEHSDIYFNLENQELDNTDIGYKYIQQNVEFINNLEVVNLFKISNKEFVKKHKNIVDAQFFLIKGESNYIYYEIEMNRRDKNTWFLAFIFIEALLEWKDK